jgi:PKHD-type hydroxylase
MPYFDFITQESHQADLYNFYYFNEVFSPEEIKTIINICEELPKEVATVDYNETTDNIRRSEIAWLGNNDDTNWIYERLGEYVNDANVEMGWNFDLNGMYEDIQYSIYYDNGGHYNWHSDIGQQTPHRKISLSLQLSTPEEYKGGKLEFNLGSYVSEANNEIGSLTLFPSYLLHRVTPVTSGVRRSLVLWVSGKPFK